MAAEANIIREPGLRAENDLSADQYRGVVMGTLGGEVDRAAALGAPIVGVLYNKPKAGAEAEVVVRGTVKAQAGDAITVGAKVSVAADGDFTPWLTTHSCVGIAKTAAGADGEIFSLMLMAIGID